jgi:hypothetical protein
MMNTNTSTLSPVLDRIRKLLRLAQNAGSEAEAALAAQRAAELMAQHEVHEAQIRLDEPDHAPEPIETAHEVTKRAGKRVAWHWRVAKAVAKSYGTQPYWSNGAIVLFGRLSAVQAATYTTQYLLREIQELCDKHCEGQRPGRAYRNAFRLGAASRVATRLWVKEVITLGDAAEAAPVATPSPSDGVMVLIERDRAEVKNAYEKYSRRFVTMSAIGSTSSSDGYTAGKEAGDRIRLSGARGALPHGQHSLKKG